MKKIKQIIPYVVITLAVVLIRSFIITPVLVNGESMEPNLLNNQFLILKKFNNDYQRFDIVVFDYSGSKLVKRIIGLPGDKIEYSGGHLAINGELVEEKFIIDKETTFSLLNLGYEKIPAGHYFVMGDNRNNSLDSRTIGLVTEKQLQGEVVFSVFPFNKFGKVE